MITVNAILLQDVSPSSSREIGYRGKVEPYIPGSVVRGALATAWIRSNGIPRSTNKKQTEFVDLYERNVRYGYLFAPDQRIVPLSVRLCKYQPDDACRGFFRDDAFLTDLKVATCTCGGPLEMSKGNATVDSRAYRTRTALTSDERPLEENLFARQVIPKGDGWSGTIHFAASNQSQSNVLAQLAELSDDVVVLGGSRSTLGRTRISGQLGTDVVPASREDGLLLIRLTAPGIFLDQFGRPTLELPLNEIGKHLGLDPNKLSVKKSWVRPTTVGGWHAASGLPKPSEWACLPGSTWLVEGVNSETDLSQLAQEALGFRRNEGNGAIEVNPRFSFVAAPVPVLAAGSASLVTDVVLSLDEREIRWLIGELKESRIRLETGQLEHRENLPVRTRQYTLEQREAVWNLLETPNLESINRSISILDGELQ